MLHLGPGVHKDRSHLYLNAGRGILFLGTVQGFLPHMGPVVVGPVTGKTLVIRRRLGLFRKLLGLQKGEKVVDKAVRLVAVTGEVQ